jgi:hypothetical protein
MKTGYIVQSWFDFTIRTGQDENRFDFFIPDEIQSYLKERNYDKKLITWFSGEDPANKIPLSDQKLQTLIKISNPWVVSIPKDWNLLVVPIPYPDVTDFEAVHGMLNAGDCHQMNAIIKINSMNNEILFLQELHFFKLFR